MPQNSGQDEEIQSHWQRSARPEGLPDPNLAYIALLTLALTPGMSQEVQPAPEACTKQDIRAALFCFEMKRALFVYYLFIYLSILITVTSSPLVRILLGINKTGMIMADIYIYKLFMSQDIDWH